MKWIYNKICEVFLEDNSEFGYFKTMVFFLILIMLVMFILDSFNVNIGGRGGNPYESYQEERY